MIQTKLARLGLILDAGLALALVLVWFDHARQDLFWQADFSMFYTAWSMVRDGDGDRLHDYDLQLARQRELLPQRDPDDGLLPFNYPPTTAVPGYLFAYLSLPVAFHAWALIQLALLVVLVRQILSFSSGWPVDAHLLLVATVLGFPALFVTFQMGQLSLLVLVCLLGLTRALEEDRPLWGAGCLVLATIKPQLAVVPVVVLLAGRRWRILLPAGVLFLAWAGLATLVVGPRAWLDWLGVLRHSARQFGTFGIFPERMYNFKGLLAGLLGPDQQGAINTASTAAFLAMLVVVASYWRGPFPQGDPFRSRWALSIQLGLLTCLHLNPADALLYVLPALLYAVAPPRDRSHPFLVGGLVACPLLFAVDCYGVTHWPGGVRPFFVVMVVLAVALGLGHCSHNRGVR